MNILTETTTPTTVPPTNLDVVPLPAREAKISWTAPAGAALGTEYTVQWAESPSSTDWESLGTTAGTELDIKLYPQLIDYDSFAVRALAGTAASEPVIIVDSPITRADGNSRSTTEEDGENSIITVKWEIPEGPNNVSLKIRKFSINTAGIWKYEEYGDDWKAENPLQNLGSHEKIIENLKDDTGHAIQLIHEHGGRKVYSGMEALAWTSREEISGTRVATFPLMKTDREYRYRTCLNDLTEETATAWRNLIQESFREWDTATDGLITTVREEEEYCADYARFSKQIENRISSRTDRTEKEIAEDISGLMENIRDSTIFDETLQNDIVGNDIRLVALDKPGLIFLYQNGLNEITETFNGRTYCLGELIEKVIAAKPFGGGTVRGCNIGNFSTFGHDIMLGLPDAEVLLPITAAEIRFDTCIPRSHEYYNMVHELGHAIGIRGYQRVPGHPAESNHVDSIMNYGFPETTVTDGEGSTHQTGAGNCSPSPLDVMAIYAMYQTDQIGE